jgi:hypothetical protein
MNSPEEIARLCVQWSIYPVFAAIDVTDPRSDRAFAHFEAITIVEHVGLVRIANK